MSFKDCHSIDCCATCKFAGEEKDTTDMHEKLSCRRHAPVAVDDYIGLGGEGKFIRITAFPQVYKMNWCGDFERKVNNDKSH